MPNADRNSDPRGQPNARGRGESLDFLIIGELKYRASAKKAYTSDDSLHHATLRVDMNTLKIQTNDKHRGAHAHQHVCT